MLHDAQEEPEKICQHRPVGVKHNTVFVVSLETVEIKDLTADDNGSWEISSPRRMFTVERDHATGMVLSVERSLTAGENVYTLFRQYGTHKATKKEKGVDFKRIIATLKDPHGRLAPLAVMQYFFKGGKEEEIVLAPHRNAKGNNKRPFLRTSASTLQSMKVNCLEKKPKMIYDEGFNKSGGLLRSNSTSDEPRNPKHASVQCKS
jgi:hypothetical protein